MKEAEEKEEEEGDMKLRGFSRSPPSLPPSWAIVSVLSMDKEKLAGWLGCPASTTATTIEEQVLSLWPGVVGLLLCSRSTAAAATATTTTTTATTNSSSHSPQTRVPGATVTTPRQQEGGGGGGGRYNLHTTNAQYYEHSAEYNHNNNRRKGGFHYITNIVSTSKLK